MSDFTSLHFSLFLTWMLTFTDVQTFTQRKTVRVGDEVTLKCENANDFSDGCNRITWLYSNSSKRTFTLFELGKIHKDAESKSDRLSLTEKCSLVLKKITDEDAGSYTCRQFSTSGHEETDFQVQLTVENTTSTATTESVLQASKPSTKTDILNKTDMTAVITAAVAVAACVLVAVMLMGWRRMKERKTQIEPNMTPPEDADSYASVTFSRNTNNRQQVLDKDAEGDAVTYSTIKVSCPH